MSKPTYPRTMPPVRCTTRDRPSFRFAKCFGGCGHTFGSREPLVIRETQVTYMRGDDIVEAFCEACWAKREAPAGKPAANGGGR
jgi:hypothetical protein